MSSFGKSHQDMKQCSYCGKSIPAKAAQCPFCREAVPQVQLSRKSSSGSGGDQIRRGLLYMLLAGVIHYFAGGYGAPIFQIPLPAPVMPMVTQYLTPLLFLGGLGFTVYGLVRKMRS